MSLSPISCLQECVGLILTSSSEETCIEEEWLSSMDCEPPSPSIITTISPNPHSRQPFGMIQKLCSTVLPAQICGNGGRRPRTIGPSRHYSSINIDIETSQADSNSDISLIVYDLAHSLICLLIVVFILLMALKCNGYVSSPT